MDANGKARQTQRTLGTYATYQEAVDALAAYNRNPLSLEPGTTFEGVYKMWAAEKYETVSESTRECYSAAFNAVPMLHETEFRKLRRNHLQKAVDISGKNYPTLKTIKVLISMLYTYAMQNDIVDKDYSRFIDISRYNPALNDEEEGTAIHTDFKREEIAALWESADDPVVQEILMLIYSGLRISEYLALTPDTIDTDTRFLTVKKSKTRSGRRRVPIAAKTLPFWRTLKEKRADLTDQRKKLLYQQFFRQMRDTLKRLGLREHLPHDTRHTAATLLHEAEIDLYVIKRILGHSTSDITESVYVHVHDEELINAIDKI